jgi:hypothetical protein
MRNDPFAAIARRLIAATLLCPLPAGAQSLVVESATALPGGRAEFEVRFVAGAREVVGFDLRFGYPGPTAFAGVVPLGGALCQRVAGRDEVAMLHVEPSLGPLPSAAACRVRLDIAPGTPAGPLALQLQAASFADRRGDEVPGSVEMGTIMVLALQPPTIAFTPPADLDAQADADAELHLVAPDGVEIAETTVVPTLAGGDAGTGMSLSCQATTGFAVVGGASQALAAGQQAEPVALACLPGPLPLAGRLECTTQALPGGAVAARQWDVRCAARPFGDGFEAALR